MNNEIREPKQKRSIETKEKIVDAGWALFAKNGYHNTNTKEIAEYANVSTGIVYQYFKDKHDILISAINKYGDNIFYPMIKINDKDFDKNDFSKIMNKMIKEYINDHKISQNAHEEIMSMVHLDTDVAAYYYNREIDLTNKLYTILINNGVNSNNLKEKVHIIIGMIDNLCHEVVYHKHSELDYKNMMNLVIENINVLLKDR